jgi:hypothetical protein
MLRGIVGSAQPIQVPAHELLDRVLSQLRKGLRFVGEHVVAHDVGLRIDPADDGGKSSRTWGTRAAPHLANKLGRSYLRHPGGFSLLRFSSARTGRPGVARASCWHTRRAPTISTRVRFRAASLDLDLAGRDTLQGGHQKPGLVALEEVSELGLANAYEPNEVEDEPIFVSKVG